MFIMISCMRGLRKNSMPGKVRITSCRITVHNSLSLQYSKSKQINFRNEIDREILVFKRMQNGLPTKNADSIHFYRIVKVDHLPQPFSDLCRTVWLAQHTWNVKIDSQLCDPKTDGGWWIVLNPPATIASTLRNPRLWSTIQHAE